MAADNGGQAESPPELTRNSDGEPLDVQIDSSASTSPRKTRRRRNTQGDRQLEARVDTAAALQPMQQAAARWNADTRTATFDWPSIEQVAAADGPNQTMASCSKPPGPREPTPRWPF